MLEPSLIKFMDTSELVLEIGTEEIPASMLERAAHKLAQLLGDALKNERLPAGSPTVWYTPRRLIVAFQDIPVQQDDLTVTVLGPPIKVAFDADGTPTQAAHSFAEKQSVPLSRIKTVTTPKGEYLGATRKTKGEKATKVLERLIPKAIAKIDFPKTMYWSTDKFRFSRPIRSILALYRGKVVRFQIADVRSSNTTFGHRFTGKRRIAVSSLNSLQKALRENNVVVDPLERRRLIEDGLLAQAEGVRGKLVVDPALLETVINLNECPSVIKGIYDRRYLELPQEILVTVMKEHQKYFSIVDAGGELLPYFLAVINLSSDPEGKIRKGHERVLRARLADAAFFWDTDRKKTSKDRIDSLRHVVFQEKLGTYYDKTERIRKLLPMLAQAMELGSLLEDLEISCRLFKSDLVTEMVKEFPDLQGIVGGLYARAEGYSESVWRAIYEHYLPKSSSSASPSTRTGAILALVDRLDTVSGCFSIGLTPTSSRDPFALRRQGNGILKILLDHQLRTSLDSLIEWSLSAHNANPSEKSTDLKKFFESRLRFLFEEMNYSYDCINAALSIGFDDPVETLARVRALQDVRDETDFLAVASNFKRVVNILAQAGDVNGEPDTSLMTDPAERSLWESYQEIQPKVDRACTSQAYGEALRLIASMRPAIDRFFDKVLVMTENKSLRNNRLSLLDKLARMFLSIADISQIVLDRAVP